MTPRIWTACGLVAAATTALVLVSSAQNSSVQEDLEQGFRNPPREARPDVYWLWLNGFVDPESARADLQAMKEAGFGGVLLFDMGARGAAQARPPAGPAFLSAPWMAQFQASVQQAKSLGLSVDFSVISSWDLGGHWIEPRHASMGLYPSETTVEGGKDIDVILPFPPAPAAAPKAAGGKPAFWIDVAVLAIPEPQRSPGQQLGPRFDPKETVDLTSRVDREGRLRWTAPQGRFTILRYVCMNTGERLKVPSPNSDGWATDHLNPDATRAHMDYVIARLRETFGDLRSSGIHNLYLASYEVRGLLWTPGFTKEFQRRRGYDMTRYLPAIFGKQAGDQDTTARFLFDYRKTLGEVLVDSYYVAARESAHKVGLTVKSEAGGPGPPVHNVPVDSLSANNAVDEVQGEFWPYRPNSDAMWVVKETASAAHLYGKPRVHEESFTSNEHWREGPQDLKASADRVFCEGGNHIVWHTWTHNAPQAGKPGWAYGAGTHINRNVTWWPKAGPFVDYLSRSSFLLQRGTFVADVLYYYGDGGYKFIGPKHVDPSLGPGYDYDVTNSDVILNRLSVRDGRLVIPGGPSYAVLVLPDSREMYPAVLAKIEKLVAAGATVVGPKPAQASGLENQPAAGAQVRTLAAQLWGNLDGLANQQRPYGQGQVVWGTPLREVLAARKLPPDVIAPEGVDFIHRRMGQAEIYFVRNTRDQPAQVKVRFRVSQRAPELWDPVTGSIQPAGVYRADANGVEVPLVFARNGSIFVVFRRPARSDAITAITPATPLNWKNGVPVVEAERDATYQVERGNARATIHIEGVPAPLTLEGSWDLEFEKGRGAPEHLTLPQLDSWTKLPDPGVRYFSGTVRYRKSFTVPVDWKARSDKVYVDLGNLWTIGQAWVNGKPLGILWTAPFRADCTAALREGTNELVVEVTNTWYNRLAGDARLPAGERLTHTNITAVGSQPSRSEPLPSGLFGPVRLVAVVSRAVGK